MGKVRIGTLQGEVRALTIEWTGDDGTVDEINLHYLPAVYTAEFEASVKDLLERERQANAAAVALDMLLVDWDVETEDEDGNPIPFAPTKENLGMLPYMFTNHVLNGINADALRLKAEAAAEAKLKVGSPGMNGKSPDAPPPNREERRAAGRS